MKIMKIIFLYVFLEEEVVKYVEPNIIKKTSQNTKKNVGN
jgi:hypothetical protein